MTQAAGAVSHGQKGYLRASFHRLKARRGWAKALVATAHKILLIAYRMLPTQPPYQERGDDYFDKLHPARTAKRLLPRYPPLRCLDPLCAAKLTP